MKIHYLYNSGFAVFLEQSLIVFDYYKNVTDSQAKDVTGGVVSDKDLLARPDVFAFVSHAHPDHFNPVIFTWQEVNANTHYFLDSGVMEPAQEKGLDNAALMEEGGEAEAAGVRVRAYGSTDAGVSFYVEAEGYKLFHAGDLNLWHWQDRSTADAAQRARRDFYYKMAAIEKTMPRPDVAFFPVDAMMGEGYDEGAQYFIHAVKPRVFIPMHCRTGTAHLKGFKEKTQCAETSVRIYENRGDTICI